MPRPYRVTTPDARLAPSRNLTRTDRICLFVIMLIASAVRLYGLAWPTSVVFDEVHFGSFARKYIIGRFFFDVHPPLAKMLFAVAGYAFGFRGDFNFDNIGDDYIEPQVPYVGMRLLPSVLGLLTIALCYCTLRASGVRTFIASFGALLLTFENTHATESRYILLDSPLLFFIAITAYGYKKFENEVPFTFNWYKFMLLTGLGLGATVSSKWVGLFTVAWIGSQTLWQLWWLIGDRSVPVTKFLQHFVARATFLIGVPLGFYMLMFYLHFLCVDNDGSGSDFMPRPFAAGLKHNNLPGDIPADVAFGSTITLRHVNTKGGWLHSHNSSYETGSQQQQITLYPHMDENNHWTVENATEEWNPDGASMVYLKDGDIIRLNHVPSAKRLHSHDHRAPVTSHDYVNEVSGYGFEGFEGDANDNWRIKIAKSYSTGAGKDKVQALRTYFQLEHTLTGCLLYSKNVKLPAWGFEQQEVSCIRSGTKPNTLWYIEYNQHEGFEDPELVSYEKPSFLRSFIDLNKSMWSVNKGLTATHNWESRPLDWLTLDRGINMWVRENRQVYLLGNLVVYLSITGSIALYIVYKLVQILYWQRFSDRALRDGLPEPIKKGSEATLIARATAWGLFDEQFTSFLLAWAFHYFPSFLMVRQLFLHHYLASVYFGVLMISQVFELVVAVVPVRNLGKILTVVFLAAAITFYAYYSPLIYGTQWTKEQCEAAKFNRMDFDCNTFLSSSEDYVAVNSRIADSIYSAKNGLFPEETEAEEQEVQEEHVEVVEEVHEEVHEEPEVPAAEPAEAEVEVAAEAEPEIIERAAEPEPEAVPEAVEEPAEEAEAEQPAEEQQPVEEEEVEYIDDDEDEEDAPEPPQSPDSPADIEDPQYLDVADDVESAPADVADPALDHYTV